MDREKVVKGINICLQRFRCGEYCPYYNDAKSGCMEQLREDALSLLIEQEKENGEWITIWQKDDPDISTDARCSICNRISERPLGEYCKWCGAKMSQERGANG